MIYIKKTPSLDYVRYYKKLITVRMTRSMLKESKKHSWLFTKDKIELFEDLVHDVYESFVADGMKG